MGGRIMLRTIHSLAKNLWETQVPKEFVEKGIFCVATNRPTFEISSIVQFLTHSKAFCTAEACFYTSSPGKFSSSMGLDLEYHLQGGRRGVIQGEKAPGRGEGDSFRCRGESRKVPVNEVEIGGGIWERRFIKGAVWMNCMNIVKKKTIRRGALPNTN